MALHDSLQLNTGQEGQWKSFAASLKPPAPTELPEPADMEALSAPGRMEKHLALMKLRETEFVRHLAATLAFYAALTPPQQRVFNEQFPPGPCIPPGAMSFPHPCGFPPDGHW